MEWGVTREKTRNRRREIKNKSAFTSFGRTNGPITHDLVVSGNDMRRRGSSCCPRRFGGTRARARERRGGRRIGRSETGKN